MLTPTDTGGVADQARDEKTARSFRKEQERTRQSNRPDAAHEAEPHNQWQPHLQTSRAVLARDEASCGGSLIEPHHLPDK
jgi:hypothetical protein